jgi:hypothetical protein
VIEQPAADQEPGDDEEDVDADVAAREARDPDVEEDDEEDGDPAQTLDVRTEAVLVAACRQAVPPCERACRR